MDKGIKKNQIRREKEQSLVPPKTQAQLQMVLCYPNRYSVGMANLGFQRVFGLFNEREEIYCDRAFYPDPEEERAHFEKNLPIYSLETRRPLGEFDLIAFSFAFELDYLNALKMLRASKIPLRSAERRKSSRKNSYPLVIAGGIAISANPEPLADFFDLIVIGDAEPVMKELAQGILELGPKPGLEELAQRFAESPHFYLPQSLETRNQKLKIARAQASEKDLPAHQLIFSPETEFSELALVELMRGCGRGCRFCLEGYFSRPPSSANYHKVIQAIERLRGFRKKMGLIAPVVSDWAGLDALLEFARREKIPVSVSSLRISAVKERLLEVLKESKDQTLTFAPEAGSQRLRRFLNKEEDEERILRAMKMVGFYQFPRIKLYYQIGFPEERELEVQEIISSARRIQTALALGAKKKSYPGVIELSVSAFIPKPWTAFQWLAMAGAEELERKFASLRSGIKAQEGFQLKTASVREAIFQGIISRGDRALGEILEKMAYGQIQLSELLKSEQILKRYLREREPPEPFPWEIIEPGVKRNYLFREYERALALKISPGCKPGCQECGAC